MTDEQLMLRAAKGDIAAFSKVVRRHQDTAWRIAYRFLGNSAESEDIAQETFFRILAAAERYKPSASFSTYLYRVVARLCIDYTRKKKSLLASTCYLPESTDSSPDPETALIQKDRDALIREALDTLPSRQRMVVVLKYYEGLNYAEIAAAVGTTAKAVERLLSRARQTLQKKMSCLEK